MTRRRLVGLAGISGMALVRAARWAYSWISDGRRRAHVHFSCAVATMTTAAKYNLSFVAVTQHNDASRARFECEEYITACVMSNMVTKQAVPFYPTVWAFMQRPSTRKYSDADDPRQPEAPQWWLCRLPHAVYGWRTDPGAAATTVHRHATDTGAKSACIVPDPLAHVLAAEGDAAHPHVKRVHSYCSDCGSADTLTKVDHTATCTSCGCVAYMDNVFTGRQYRRFEGEEDRNHCAERGDDPHTVGFEKQRHHIYSVMQSMNNPHGRVYMANRYITQARRVFDAHRHREERIHYLHVVVSACLVFGYWQQQQSPHLKSVRFHHTEQPQNPPPSKVFRMCDMWTDMQVRHSLGEAAALLSSEPALCAACKRTRLSTTQPKSLTDDNHPPHTSADGRSIRRGSQRRKRGLNTHLPLDHPLWRASEDIRSAKRPRSASLEKTQPAHLVVLQPPPPPAVVDDPPDTPRVLLSAVGAKLLSASAQRVLAERQLPAHTPTLHSAHGLLVADVVDLYQRGFLLMSAVPCRVAVPCTQCAAVDAQTTCHLMRTITDAQMVAVWNDAVRRSCAFHGKDAVMGDPDVEDLAGKVLSLVHTRVRSVVGVVRMHMRMLHSFMSNLYHEATRGVEYIDPRTHVLTFSDGQKSPFSNLHLRHPWRLFCDPHTHHAAFVNTRSHRATWQPPPSLKWPPIPVGWSMVVREGALRFVCLRTGHTSTMFPSTVAHGHVYVNSFPRLSNPHVRVDAPAMVATDATRRNVCAGYPFYEPPAVLDPMDRLRRLRAVSVIERRTVTPDATITIRRHTLHRRFWFGDHMLWRHQIHALHTIVNSTICEQNTWVSSGIAIVPCGGGKTLIGISVMGVVGAAHSMVVCNNSVSCEQWRKAIVAHTTLGNSEVTILTSSTEDIHPRTRVVVASYSSMLSHSALQRIDWGVIVLDEVHMVGASSLRRFFNSKNASLCSIVGLTATPLREDNHFKELHHIIGPFLYRTQWTTLVKQGIVATMRCVDVKCRMSFGHEYTHATSEIERKFFSALNTEKIRLCASLLRHHLEQGHQVLIFFEELFVMRTYATLLKDTSGYPLVKIESKENQSIVSKALEDFRRGCISVLCFSRTGDSSFDIPNASVGIQISSHNGSRRQEMQRMGRISRSTHVGVPPAPGQIDSYFYTLTSSDTREVHDRAHRTQYMADDEFNFEHVTMHGDSVNDGMWAVIHKGMRRADITLQPINKKRITRMIRAELKMIASQSSDENTFEEA